MTKVIPFKPEHLQSLDKDMFNRLGLIPNWVEKAKQFNWNGTCYSGFVDDELIACAGVNILWKGVGEAWAVITPRIYEFPLFFHKTVVRGIDAIIEKHELHRLQASVVAGFDKGKKWLERLGFEREGIMRKYDAEGSDHDRYAKIMYRYKRVVN